MVFETLYVNSVSPGGKILLEANYAHKMHEFSLAKQVALSYDGDTIHTGQRKCIGQK